MGISPPTEEENNEMHTKIRDTLDLMIQTVSVSAEQYKAVSIATDLGQTSPRYRTTGAHA